MSDEEAKIAIKQLLIYTIMSQSARRIDFTIGRVSLRFSEFNQLFQYLTANRIGVGFADFPPLAVAEYVSKDNKYYFRDTNFPNTIGNRETLIHESIHAIQDIRGAVSYGSWGASISTFMSCEAAAYIAEALYRFYETGEYYPQKSSDIQWRSAELAKKIVRGENTISAEDERVFCQTLTRSYRIFGNTIDSPAAANGV